MFDRSNSLPPSSLVLSCGQDFFNFCCFLEIRYTPHARGKMENLNLRFATSYVLYTQKECHKMKFGAVYFSLSPAVLRQDKREHYLLDFFDEQAQTTASPKYAQMKREVNLILRLSSFHFPNPAAVISCLTFHPNPTQPLLTVVVGWGKRTQ